MPGWIARHGGDPERSVTLVMTDQHADTHEPPICAAVPLMSIVTLVIHIWAICRRVGAWAAAL